VDVRNELFRENLYSETRHRVIAFSTVRDKQSRLSRGDRNFPPDERFVDSPLTMERLHEYDRSDPVNWSEISLSGKSHRLTSFLSQFSPESRFRYVNLKGWNYRGNYADIGSLDDSPGKLIGALGRK
jgi:hypothetical protein